VDASEGGAIGGEDETGAAGEVQRRGGTETAVGVFGSGDFAVETSDAGKVMRNLKDMSATLTFLPEGLRAVVVIDRK